MSIVVTSRRPSPWRWVLGLVLALILTLGTWWAVSHPDALVPTAASSAPTDLPQPGHKAPDFTTTSLDGKQLSLSEMRGKPVWLTFGASWCTGCRSESPDVQAVAQRYDGRVQVLAGYLEEQAAAEQFVATLKLSYPGFADPDRTIATKYRAGALPVHFFINAEGVIRKVHVGAISQAQAVAAVEDTLHG